MAVYMMFPVGCFWVYHQPEFHERLMSKTKMSVSLSFPISAAVDL